MVSGMLLLLDKYLINERMNETVLFSTSLHSKIIAPLIELAFSFEEAGHLNVIGLQDDFLSVACGNNIGILKQLFRLTSTGAVEENRGKQNI